MYISYIYTTAANGQECTDTVGSLDHRNIPIVFNHEILILAGYTIPCDGTVVAWEFCYQISNAASVTFHLGILTITEMSDNKTKYSLVQSNNVTYDPRGSPDNPYPCKIFNLSVAEQFTAPAGSVVGLYSNTGPLLLRTSIDSSITTYKLTMV